MLVGTLAYRMHSNRIAGRVNKTGTIVNLTVLTDELPTYEAPQLPKYEEIDPICELPHAKVVDHSAKTDQALGKGTDGKVKAEPGLASLNALPVAPRLATVSHDPVSLMHEYVNMPSKHTDVIYGNVQAPPKSSTGKPLHEYVNLPQAGPVTGSIVTTPSVAGAATIAHERIIYEDVAFEDEDDQPRYENVDAAVKVAVGAQSAKNTMERKSTISRTYLKGLTIPGLILDQLGLEAIVETYHDLLTYLSNDSFCPFHLLSYNCALDLKFITPTWLTNRKLRVNCA